MLLVAVVFFIQMKKMTQKNKQLKKKKNRECFIMTKLKHENLVKLYGISLCPRVRMFIEFVPGGDLQVKYNLSQSKQTFFLIFFLIFFFFFFIGTYLYGTTSDCSC